MPSIIHVEEDAIVQLKSSFLDAGVEYKQNLAKLDHLIEQIVSGDFQGDAADDFVSKYREKEATFKKIVETLEEAEEKMGLKTTKFGDMMGEIKSTMRQFLEGRDNMSIITIKPGAAVDDAVQIDNIVSTAGVCFLSKIIEIPGIKKYCKLDVNLYYI